MVNIFNFNHLNSFDSFSYIELILYSLILLSIGSFTSSIIFRLSSNLINNNKRLSIYSPRSFCPICNKTIKVINLLPVFGFLLQKGKCSSCKNNISPFYLFTEISFLVFGLAIVFFYGFDIFSFLLLCLFFLFYILFFLDLKFYYLPLPINLLVIVLGFIGNSFFNIFVSDVYLLFDISPFLFSLYGFVIGYVSLWLVNFIFRLFYKKDGIGGGDFILFGGLGSLFGPFSLGLILFFGALTGCIIFLFFRKKFELQAPLGSCLILGSVFYFFIKNFELLNNYIVL